MNIKLVIDGKRVSRNEVADMFRPTDNTPAGERGRLLGRFRVHAPDVHALLWNCIDRKSQGMTTTTGEALAEFKPWREVGWIFRDGNCIAIERKGEETRTRDYWWTDG